MARAIIYTNPYHLGGEKLTAVVKAMAVLGEDSFYITVTEDDQEPTRLVTGEMVAEWGRGYYSGDQKLADVAYLTLENVIYSCRGTWGIWLTQDSYGLVGSSSHEFLDTLLANYPQAWSNTSPGSEVRISVADSPVDLVRFYVWIAKAPRQRDYIARWMIPLLEHMYGKQRAVEILHEGGWSGES